MKTKFILCLLAASSFILPSCMTTYDAYGRPVQSVDPGLAAVGIVGAGLVGAAIANSNNSNNNHSSHRSHRSHSYHQTSHSYAPSHYYNDDYCDY